MACRDYDWFPLMWETPDGKEERMEVRHYDAGCDGGKGEYQRWRENNRIIETDAGQKWCEEAWYEKTVTQGGWDYWYEELSEAAKVQFESERTARLAMKARDGGMCAQWTDHTQIVHADAAGRQTIKAAGYLAIQQALLEMEKLIETL
jgi:hypothetical protein